MGEARNRRRRQAAEEKEMAFERYDFGHIPTIEEMEGQFEAATPGQWRQGHSTHNVVSVSPDTLDPKHLYCDSYAGRDAYRIGDFHHGADGWFALMAHKFVPWAIAEIRRLRRESTETHAFLKVAEMAARLGQAELNRIDPFKYSAPVDDALMDRAAARVVLDVVRQIAGDEERTARPRSEWHEDIANCLWWRFPVEEPPYCGSPLDEDFPDHVTHWTPLPPIPEAPAP